jgi:hypothetical protein
MSHVDDKREEFAEKIMFLVKDMKGGDEYGKS